MKLIVPMAVTDTELADSNIAEDEHPEWDVSATYAAQDRVIVIGSTHKVYESVVGSNLGNDPTTDDGTNWLEISATNKWKAFDLKLADQASRASQITYSIVPTSIVDGLAFFNLNAGSVRVQVYDDSSPRSLIYDSTVDLTDTTDVIDWFTFYFGGVDYDTEALFVGIPGYTGFQIDITIDAASGDAKVGQVVPGRVHSLGDTLDGTSIGIQDFSTKTRDDFGNATIVERSFADQTTFEFSLITADARRVKRVLSSVRARPAVYFVEADTAHFGATVFGYFQDFGIPLRSGSKSFATLEIEGLT